jgi:hypothetical protein
MRDENDLREVPRFATTNDPDEAHRLRSLMARLGHASAAAAIRYQHKLEGQDAKIADFLDVIGRSALPNREEAG